MRAYYLRLATQKKKNNRPYDMVISDFFAGT